MTGQHSHCLVCRQVNCNVFTDDENGTSCEMCTCEDCARRFHSCKRKDHALICLESRVSCVNAGNGCPHLVKRSEMALHLPVCPASVISCSEEWCRWPMYAPEKGIRHSLPLSKTYIDCSQLDVSLAMRDQRMLQDMLKAPKRLRQSLRTRITHKYPPAPLPPINRGSSIESDLQASVNTSQTVSDDETDTPWDLNRLHSGLKESIRIQLCQLSKVTTDEVATALSSPPDVTCNEDQSEAEVSSTANRDCETTGEKYEDHVSVHETENREMSRSRSNVSSERSSVSRSRSASILRDVGGTQLHRITGEKLVDGNDPEISLHKILGVNLKCEMFSRFEKKPTSMYTFICAQNFRRDEYKWHFKNVHQEIHSYMHGWMEQRCPLAYLGCTFSFRRLIPSNPGTVLCHSSLQESFGLKSLAQPICTPLDRDNESPQQPISCQRQHSQQLETDNKTSLHQKHQNKQQSSGIDDLGKLDKEFDSWALQQSSNLSKRDLDVCPKVSSVTTNDDDGVGEDTRCSMSRSQSISESGRNSEEREAVMNVRPMVYTSTKAESTVIFEYDLEEGQVADCTRKTLPGMVDLPIEVLQLISKRLDSFSLCNLALTCRKLREVCCSLLDNHGIVTLNWKRQKIGDKISWHVANKRWMFSTSFEPIKSWRFNPDQPSLGEHLKTCPFNKDCNTHTENVKVISSELGVQIHSRFEP